MIPSALVFFCLSDPARSTRCSLEWKLLFLWQKQTILLAEVNLKLGKKQSSCYYTWAKGLRNTPVIRDSLNKRIASGIAQLSCKEKRRPREYSFNKHGSWQLWDGSNVTLHWWHDQARTCSPGSKEVFILFNGANSKENEAGGLVNWSDL